MRSYIRPGFFSFDLIILIRSYFSTRVFFFWYYRNTLLFFDLFCLGYLYCGTSFYSTRVFFSFLSMSFIVTCLCYSIVFCDIIIVIRHYYLTWVFFFFLCDIVIAICRYYSIRFPPFCDNIVVIRCCYSVDLCFSLWFHYCNPSLLFGQFSFLLFGIIVRHYLAFSFLLWNHYRNTSFLFGQFFYCDNIIAILILSFEHIFLWDIIILSCRCYTSFSLSLTLSLPFFVLQKTKNCHGQRII